MKLGQAEDWSGPLTGGYDTSFCMFAGQTVPTSAPGPTPNTRTPPAIRGLPRMNGPALFALFPEIPLPRAFALADVSPAPLSDALRFILNSR